MAACLDPDKVGAQTVKGREGREDGEIEAGGGWSGGGGETERSCKEYSSTCILKVDLPEIWISFLFSFNFIFFFSCHMIVYMFG